MCPRLHIMGKSLKSRTEWKSEKVSREKIEGNFVFKSLSKGRRGFLRRLVKAKAHTPLRHMCVIFS